MILTFSIDNKGKPSNRNSVLSWLYSSYLNGNMMAKKEFDRLIKIYNKRDIGGGYTTISNIYSENSSRLGSHNPNYKNLGRWKRKLLFMEI